ncbi:MAG: lipocalin family protein [Alistipes sp.]
MKSIKILALALIAVAVASCANKEPKQYTGFIEDATMNNVVVKELTGDQTAVFSTDDADMSQANGLLIGNLIVVDYVGDLKEVTPATKIATDMTYAKAIGEWTMPNPIAADSVGGTMGVKLMVEGVAESINMATLRYTSWELQGESDKILLKGTSEGSGEPVEFTQTALISGGGGSETLAIEGTEVVLTKQAF